MFGLEWRVPLYREYVFYILSCRNWREVIKGRRYGRPFRRFHLRSGIVIEFTQSPPWVMFNDIWSYKDYTRQYRQPGAPPRVIVDVGANIGIFSLFAASHWTGAEIWAYEPEPRNFDQLFKNVQLNSNARIHPIQAAASAKSGKARLLVKQEAGGHSLYSENGEMIQETVEVSSVSLEDIIMATGGRWIDFLKVDCEGAEYELLVGKEEILRNGVGYIAMEYHENFGRKVEELIATFQTAGLELSLYPDPRYPTGFIFSRNRNPRIR